FTVTIAMTSLVGCSGEEFASILRSLGYRMDKRPKPPPQAPAPVVDAPVAPLAEGGAADSATLGSEAQATSESLGAAADPGMLDAGAVVPPGPEPLATALDTPAGETLETEPAAAPTPAVEEAHAGSIPAADPVPTSVEVPSAAAPPD